MSNGRLLVVAAAVALLSGCASMPGMPGYSRVSESKFDGSKQITMEPAWLWDSPIKFALYWNTRMPDEEVVLIAYVKGAEVFAGGHSLEFNIDGDIVGFESIDQATQIETSPGVANSVAYIPASNFSSQRYVVDRAFISTWLV